MKKQKIFLSLVLTFCSHFIFAQPQQPPAAVEVKKVESKSLAPIVWVPGTVISRQDSKVAAEVSGVLVRVADVGEKVKKGQSLAQINDRALQLELRNNKSEIKRLLAKLEFTKTQLKRSLQLAETSSTAQYRVDELEMERDVLMQEIEAAKIERDKTLYDIERAKIEAPFDGVVVERKHWPGEHITTGEEVVRLVNLEAIEISAKAPITVSQFVRASQEAEIKTDNKNVISKVRTLIPVGDVHSRMLEVRLEISERENWVVGEAVKVALTHGASSPSLAVPRDALVLRNNLVYVFRVNAENKAERVEVVTGDGNGSDIAVKGPLSEGDLIVTRGAERLSDGREVNILKEVARR